MDHGYFGNDTQERERIAYLEAELAKAERNMTQVRHDAWADGFKTGQGICATVINGERADKAKLEARVKELEQHSRLLEFDSARLAVVKRQLQEALAREAGLRMALDSISDMGQGKTLQDANARLYGCVECARQALSTPSPSPLLAYVEAGKLAVEETRAEDSPYSYKAFQQRERATKKRRKACAALIEAGRLVRKAMDTDMGKGDGG